MTDLIYGLVGMGLLFGLPLVIDALRSRFARKVPVREVEASRK